MHEFLPFRPDHEWFTPARVSHSWLHGSHFFDNLYGLDETAVYLRSWYFLPDKEIMNALLSQAENGVRITILFSHNTRVPLIDIANRWLTRQLTKANVNIYRYADGYMHAKEAWNDQGDVLFGSANIDLWALRTNFECCLHIVDTTLTQRLTCELNNDVNHCLAPEKQTQRLRPALQIT